MNTLLVEPKKVNRLDLELRVKDMYKKVALNPEEEYHFEMGRALAERLGYPRKVLNKIPAQSIASFAGVGHFFDQARLKEGESVVDLGSGSGMDVFFAALKVCKKGNVIGIDMTPEQLEKSKNLGVQAGFKNVDFIQSYIEYLPVGTNTTDVVISNGVVNLSSEKANVFQEAARILKPGGRLVLSDIVTTSKLPEEISCDATLWAACIGGAMQVEEYFKLIENAGFELVEQKENPYAFLSDGAQGATKDYGIKSISLLAIKT